MNLDKLVSELTKDFSHASTEEEKAARLICLAALGYLCWVDNEQKLELIGENIDPDDLADAIDLLTT